MNLQLANKSLVWIADWSYNAEGKYVEIARYTSGSTKEKISAITISLGTGNANYTTGTNLTGNGAAITTYVKIGDSDASNSVIVTNKVGQSSYSSGTYPTKSDLIEYTFSFSSGVEISPDTTVSVYVKTPATTSGETGQVLCVGESGTATYAVVEEVEYTVTFESNGGTVVPSSYIEPAGTVITLPTPFKSYVLIFDANGGSVSPSSAIRSCLLSSWNTKSDGSGISYDAGATYTVNSNVTLYAIWSNPTAGLLPTPTRSNCTFDMWTTTKNGNTQVSSGTVLTSDTATYAKWKYNVVLDGNGGTVYYDGSDVENITLLKTHGADLTIPNYIFYLSESDPDEPQSHVFKGYNESSSATSIQYSADSKFSKDAPTTLYAIYEINKYTVVFTDGYSGNILKSQTVNYGGNATPPAAPLRDGYVFQGWIGNYTNVKENSTVKAFWGFTPIWIMTSSGWKKYEPKER